MDLRGYLTALRKGWILIAAVAVVGTLFAIGAYLLTPAQYASTVTFYISTPVDTNENAQSAGQFAQNRVASYVEVLQSDRLAQTVARQTGLSADDVIGTITASAEANTVLVTATVTDPSPQLAGRVAEGVATAFPTLVDTLDNAGRQDSVVKVNVTSGPTASVGPVAPSRTLYGVAGLGGGLILGVILAVARALLDQSIHTPDEASAAVGAPNIGSIVADNATKRTPLIVEEAAASVRAEEFRQLRTGLKFIDAAKRVDVLLVTSSTPQEGKSSLSTNLAISLAEDGDKVLLIEADLRRPAAARLLGLDQRVGLTSVLVDRVKLEDAVQEWGYHGLHFLASGEVPPNPAELLGSPAMRSTIDQLRQRYDRIVIDSPPVLAVTDAAVLATLADGILFVVRADKTHRASVVEASRTLNEVGGRIVGSVLNMRKQSTRQLAPYAYTWKSHAGGPARARS